MAANLKMIGELHQPSLSHKHLIHYELPNDVLQGVQGLDGDH